MQGYSTVQEWWHDKEVMNGRVQKDEVRKSFNFSISIKTDRLREKPVSGIEPGSPRWWWAEAVHNSRCWGGWPSFRSLLPWSHGRCPARGPYSTGSWPVPSYASLLSSMQHRPKRLGYSSSLASPVTNSYNINYTLVEGFHSNVRLSSRPSVFFLIQSVHFFSFSSLKWFFQSPTWPFLKNFW